MRTIVIDPVTRIEGHAKVAIRLDAEDRVSDAVLHVTQFRGFEKFVEGRPFYEMPGITSRICGICPVSHLLASAKACDAIMSVRIPPAAARLREAVHCGQIVQSHALSFFHLSGPDLLLGFDSEPAHRNVFGLIAGREDVARDGIALRKFGQQVIEGIAGERIHPSWIVPGGVAAPLDATVRDRLLAQLPAARAAADRTIAAFKGMIDSFGPEIESFGNAPTLYAGLVRDDGRLELYDGMLRFRDAAGEVVVDGMAAADYERFIAEAALPTSYLKAPFFRPLGFPAGAYRVGPLARLNVATRCGTPAADEAFAEYHQRFGAVVQSAFHFHYARLIEIIYALERLEALLDEASVLDRHVRAQAGVNALEGVGLVEAPRGVLIHHYRVNEGGAVTWANLIVATGHNTLAMNQGILQVARRFVASGRIAEGALNRVEAVIRCYDPCLSCSTHAVGTMPLRLQLIDARGHVLDEAVRG